MKEGDEEKRRMEDAPITTPSVAILRPLPFGLLPPTPVPISTVVVRLRNTPTAG